MIELTDDDLDSLTENMETLLRAGGKIMQCLDKYNHRSDDDDSRSGERRGMRYGGGDYRDGYREDPRFNSEMGDRYGERRGGGRRY